jgi:hypothetical protein
MSRATLSVLTAIVMLAAIVAGSALIWLVVAG